MQSLFLSSVTPWRRQARESRDVERREQVRMEVGEGGVGCPPPRSHRLLMGKQPDLVLPGASTAQPNTRRSKMRAISTLVLLALIAHTSAQLLWPVNQLPFRLAGNGTTAGGPGVHWREKRAPRIAVIGAGAGGAHRLLSQCLSRDRVLTRRSRRFVGRLLSLALWQAQGPRAGDGRHHLRAGGPRRRPLDRRLALERRPAVRPAPARGRQERHTVRAASRNGRERVRRGEQESRQGCERVRTRA